MAEANWRRRIWDEKFDKNAVYTRIEVFDKERAEDIFDLIPDEIKIEVDVEDWDIKKPPQGVWGENHGNRSRV